MKNVSKTVVGMVAVGFSLGLLSGCMGMTKDEKMMHDKEMKGDGMKGDKMMKEDKMMDKEMDKGMKK